MSEDKLVTRIRLENVRLAGHSLYTPSAFSEGQDAKFSASVLFDKKSDTAKEVKALIEKVAKAQWGGAAAQTLKQLFAADKMCLHDGAIKADKDGYDETLNFFNASSKSRPGLFDRARNPVTEADSVIYSGCYVNFIVELWAQDNKWGKRINAELKGVQFVSDGERLGGAAPASAEDFPDLEDEGDAGGDWEDKPDVSGDDWDA